MKVMRPLPGILIEFNDFERRIRLFVSHMQVWIRTIHVFQSQVPVGNPEKPLCLRASTIFRHCI